MYTRVRVSRSGSLWKFERRAVGPLGWPFTSGHPQIIRILEIRVVSTRAARVSPLSFSRHRSHNYRYLHVISQSGEERSVLLTSEKELLFAFSRRERPLTLCRAVMHWYENYAIIKNGINEPPENPRWWISLTLAVKDVSVAPVDIDIYVISFVCFFFL